MMEIIKKVKEIRVETASSRFIGYEVVTTEQIITLLITADAQCCENFGFFWCNDRIKPFIGAKLLNVSITAEPLNENKLEDVWAAAMSMPFKGVVITNLETSEGILQFIIYNQNNGRYYHDFDITSIQYSNQGTI